LVDDFETGTAGKFRGSTAGNEAKETGKSISVGREGVEHPQSIVMVTAQIAAIPISLSCLCPAWGLNIN